MEIALHRATDGQEWIHVKLKAFRTQVYILLEYVRSETDYEEKCLQLLIRVYSKRR